MIIVEIESTEVVIKSGVSARNNKPYQIREQSGYVHIPPNKYPQLVKITLEDEAKPYLPGKYSLADSSFFVGQFGSLQMRPRLVSQQTKPTAAAS